MCIGIPMRVFESDDTIAECDGRNGRQRLNVLLIGKQPPGTWVLAFQGSAIRVITEEEARRTASALDALEAALAGASDIDTFFSDLVEREPQLPAFLRGDAP